MVRVWKEETWYLTHRGPKYLERQILLNFLSLQKCLPSFLRTDTPSLFGDDTKVCPPQDNMQPSRPALTAPPVNYA